MELTAQKEEVIKALHWRYATKKFDLDKKLSAEQVDQLIEATRLSASSYGLQPYRLVVVEDAATRDELRAASYNQAQISEASHLFVFASATNLDDAYVDRFVELIAETRGINRSYLADYEAAMKGSVNGKDMA